MNIKEIKNLALKQEQEILSYPIYFLYDIRTAALKGEDIKTTAERFITDWASFI